MFKIKIDVPTDIFEALKKISDKKRDILNNIGIELADLITDWMRDLNSSRSPRSNWYFPPDVVDTPNVKENSVELNIGVPGISRAFHDLIIRPVEAKALAIPLHESAYGIQPREWNTRNPKGTPDALFKLKNRNLLARKGDSKGSLILMYVLKDQVKVPQDRSLLPSDSDISNATLEAISDAVDAILRNSK